MESLLMVAQDQLNSAVNKLNEQNIVEAIASYEYALVNFIQLRLYTTAAHCYHMCLKISTVFQISNCKHFDSIVSPKLLYLTNLLHPISALSSQAEYFLQSNSPRIVQLLNQLKNPDSAHVGLKLYAADFLVTQKLFSEASNLFEQLFIDSLAVPCQHKLSASYLACTVFCCILRGMPTEDTIQRKLDLFTFMNEKDTDLIQAIVACTNQNELRKLTIKIIQSPDYMCKSFFVLIRELLKRL